MRLVIVHHGDAVGPEIDLRRPLSAWGRDAVERLAADAAGRGVKPDVIWHSGKLRACNPFAEFSATRDLQPDDSPQWMRDRLRGESRDILIAGHYPHLPRLLTLLLAGAGRDLVPFPLNGIVALKSDDEGETFSEEWRRDPRADPRRA